MHGHLTDEQATGIQSGNDLRKESPVHVIKQDDQIEACTLKVVLCGIDRKQFDFDIELTGGLTELTNSDLGNVHCAYLPRSLRQPQRMSS